MLEANLNPSFIFLGDIFFKINISVFSWVQKILWVPKLFQTQYQLYINPSYIDPILTLYRPYIDSIPAQSAVLATSAEPAAPFVPFFLSLF